ncbi:OmpA family protein [Belliella kenyensis]|uniref:OmpA family protein n=1 Tax=Belliella kenyensis TaxID=1472724 RepID=A0ABV8EML8_9BACT|nr:OmpA family protein [Belliella kenyensis]MCH7401464.1 OmpA family protein [Belliella kenyensis]MDN3603255.1 OmpA family protein [Belliella kenyensis]
MKNLYLKILFVITFSLFSFQELRAQNAILRYADKQFELQNFSHAASEYERAFERRERYSTARRIAESYTEIRSYDKSYEWWKKTISFDESDRDDYVQYIKSALLFQNADFNVDQMLEQTSFEKADFPEFDFDFLAKLYKKNPGYRLDPVEGVNSSGSDFGSAFDSSGNMYFASDRGEVTPSKKAAIRPDLNDIYSKDKYDFNDREFFRIYRKNDQDEISEIDPGSSEVLHFSDVTFLNAQDLIFYTVTRNIRKAKGNRSFAVGAEIFYSKIDEAGNLTEHKSLPFNDAINYSVMHPHVDEEAKRIYFSSDMPGGLGGFDLYYVDYNEDMSFGSPVNLGSEINTAKDESHPFKSGDFFYFSSNGHPGMGGLDVFKTSYNSGKFQGIENLGLPYNSNRDDFAFSVSPEGRIYLSSDRDGGLGLDDIYSLIALNKKLLAKIIDCDGELFTESFEAMLKEKDSKNPIETSRDDDGALTAELPVEQSFELSITKPGYFSIFDNTLTTVGLEEDVLERTYRLAKIPYQMPVYVDIVYYDLDKSFIRLTEEPVLDKIGELMGKYEFLDLKVSSHTDSRASYEYNEALSQRRADAVSEYLKRYNVGPDRIRADWFGEEKLTNDCGDGVPCPEWEHQLNRRSELVLEAFPDPTKQYELPKELLDKDICDEIGIFEELQRELNAIPIVYFDFDKSFIRPVHRKELERTAVMMNRMPHLNLDIEGHTDQRGSVDYNIPLSERRAKVVMDYLKKRGVEAARMNFVWYGKSKPIHDCGECTEAMHQENRRTELKLRK